MQIVQTSLGSEDLGLRPFLDKLALINYARNRYDKTEELYKQSLSIREKASGKESVEIMDSLGRLAEFYQLRGNYF